MVRTSFVEDIFDMLAMTERRDGPVVTLIDGDGRTRAAMAMDRDVAGLFLMDTNGKPVWAAP